MLLIHFPLLLLSLEAPFATAQSSFDRDVLKNQHRSGVVSQADQEGCLDPAKNFLTSHGVFYNIDCYRTHLGVPRLRYIDDLENFEACLEACDLSPKCGSVSWHWSWPGSRCGLCEGSEPASYDYDQLSWAYRVDPPTEPTQDEDLVACSTKCPSCNGLSYTTNSGENFRMICGKRHGAAIIAKQTGLDFAGCIDSCASLKNCSSVDYHELTAVCYLSNHHGEPTVSTPGFSSAYLIGNLNGCGECSRILPPPLCPTPEPLPRPPTCPGPEPTPPLPDLSCGNQGFGFAVYPNTVGGKPNKKSDRSYSSFIPARFNEVKPEYTNVTTSLIIADATSIYGYKPKNYEFTAVNHKGYLFAQKAGEYTFSILKADGIAVLWVGPSAKFNWTRSSASLTQIHPPTPSNVYKANFTQGQYVEVRAVWANGGDKGNFHIQVTGPNGEVVVGEPGVKSPFLVQFSCNSEAGRWNDWGDEIEGTPEIEVLREGL